MAVTPPSPLKTGDPLTAIVPWTQKIVAYLRAITPRPSATVKVSITPNGTLLSAAPSQTSCAPSANTPSTAAFHAVLAKYDADQDEYTIAYKGGSASFFPGDSMTTLASGTATSDGADLYAYLLYTPGNEGADGEWTLEIDEENSSYPTPSDGEIVVPLWHFDYAEDGAGTLTQEFEGGVMVPKLRNAVDA